MTLDSPQQKIEEYFREIQKWTKKINLMSKRDSKIIRFRHMAEVELMATLVPKKARVLDIGTGNGFPSLPLSILRSDIDVLGIESNQKKVFFINNVNNKLKIKNHKVLWGRYEVERPEFADSFDVITWRAISPFSLLVEKSLFYAKKVALYLIFKPITQKDLRDIEKIPNILIHTVNKNVYKNGLGHSNLLYSLKLEKVRNLI